MRLIRLKNLLLILLGQTLVCFRLLEDNWWVNQDLVLKMVFLVLATLASAAGGYIINDYYDVKIDVLNKPRKVVVGHIISRRKAMIAHLILFVTAAGLGLLASRKIGITVFFCSFWLWFYSNKLKRLPFIGNLSIAVLTGVALFLPSLLVPAQSGSLIFYCLFAFWTTLFREIVKDMEDIRGDVKHGCRTLPIVWGIPATRNFLYRIGVLFLGTVFWASLSLPLLWKGLALAMAVPLYFFYRELSKADTQASFSRLSTWIKWMMLAGTVSMLMI